MEKEKKGFSSELNLIEDFELEQFKIPDGFSAFLDDTPLCDEKTTNGVSLFWAPKPFNQRSGRTRRAFDIPLVGAWFKERCPTGYPVKVIY